MVKKRLISSLVLAAWCGGVLPPAVAQQSSAPGLQNRVAGLFSSNKEDELLEPDDAFKLKVSFKNATTLVADLIPANGYYLYKDKVRFALKDASGVAIEAVNLPPGDVKMDQFFGKMETYPRPVKAEITLNRAPKAKNFTLVATYQGCNIKQGVCYPPIVKSIKMTLP
ncbi:protein-disulfide reductase DsbD N-terminal domain-containing protein [Cupriavidus metallidurans]